MAVVPNNVPNNIPNNIYVLPKASDEQKAALTGLTKGNVVIESVAGSGKTTTVLFMAKVFKQKLLLLTYNAKLKLETREKAQQLGLDNIEIHSYNSFGVSYINHHCCTDEGIIQYIESIRFVPDGVYKYLFPQYSIIIVDEAQDMTPVFFEMVKSIRNQSPNTLICILGDEKQNIYAFNKADSRFITMAERVFGGINWSRVKLSTSYRITTQMADFINNCVLKSEHMRAVKNGVLPRYIYLKFKSDYLLNEIVKYLGVYRPDDIFILAFSVRGSNNSPVKRLANALSSKGVPVYMPNDDNRKLDDDVLRGKVVFSSFHQAKGLERKVVIVMGFDASYYLYYNKNARKDTCPNEIYVAITRASEHLLLVHSSDQDYLPFINKDLIPIFCNIVGIKGKNKEPLDQERSIAVVELIRHISSDLLSKCIAMLKIDVVCPGDEHIHIPVKTEQKDLYGDTLFEEVSDITGTAIPAYYQYSTTRKMDIARDIAIELGADLPADLHLPLRSPEHLLKIANYYNAIRSNLVYKINQIHQYTWLSRENLENATRRLAARLGPNPVMETGFRMNLMGRTISGYIDAITHTDDDNGILWEIKCTNELTSEHMLQLAIYALMHRLATGKVYIYYLYNVMTDEIKQLTADLDTFIIIAGNLIHKKYHASETISDEEFIRRCTGVVANDVICPQCARNAPPRAELIRR